MYLWESNIAVIVAFFKLLKFLHVEMFLLWSLMLNLLVTNSKRSVRLIYKILFFLFSEFRNQNLGVHVYLRIVTISKTSISSREYFKVLKFGNKSHHNIIVMCMYLWIDVIGTPFKLKKFPHVELFLLNFISTVTVDIKFSSCKLKKTGKQNNPKVMNLLGRKDNVKTFRF